MDLSLSRVQCAYNKNSSREKSTPENSWACCDGSLHHDENWCRVKTPVGVKPTNHQEGLLSRFAARNQITGVQNAEISQENALKKIDRFVAFLNLCNNLVGQPACILTNDRPPRAQLDSMRLRKATDLSDQGECARVRTLALFMGCSRRNLRELFASIVGEGREF